MYIPNNLYTRIKHLCDNIGNRNQVLRAMIQAIKSSMKKINSRCAYDLLHQLNSEGVCTLDIKYGMRYIEKHLNERTKSMIEKKIMRKKLNNAYITYKAIQKANVTIWRKCKQIIPRDVCVEYIIIWKEYIQSYLIDRRKKCRVKLKWLKEKQKAKKKCSDSIRGIKISDSVLSEEFTSTPRVYGNIELNENELSILSLPPKFGLLQQVRVNSCLIDCEMAINKIRWRRIFNNEHGTSPEFFDIDKQTMDINAIRPTDLPFNPYVKMPGATTKEEEITFMNFKNEVRNLAKEMEGKQKKYSNIDAEAKKGLESLRQKVRDNSIICYQTDKSGRWACDSVDNYKNACSLHIEGSEAIEEINMDKHYQAERELNCHTLALTRMLGLNSDVNGNRLRNALTTEGNILAPFYCLRKDHKEVPPGQEMIGPKTRPVCGAKDCLTRRISYIMCMILKELIPKEPTNCDSTQDLLAEFEIANNGEIKMEYVVGSLDVEALYPSLDVTLCAKVVGNMLYESNIQIDNLTVKEITLYLKYNSCDEDIDEMKQYLPSRKSKIGRPPIFVCSGSDKDESVRYKPWVFPEDTVDGQVVRRLFCNAVEILISKTMSLHDFKFDQKIYRQIRGGSIGLDLTGVVATIFMCYWDKKLKQQLEENEINVILYKRYVDDIDIIVKDNNYEEKNEERTMKNIQQYANSIETSIKTTIDYSSNYEDNKLPVLDLKVWIGYTTSGEVKILHEHYMKNVSSRMLIHANSGHPMDMKKSILVNEVVRILRNCSSLLKWEDIIPHIEYFVKRMQFSGYEKALRHEIISKALKVQDRNISKYDREGVRYIPSRNSYNERRKNRKEKRKNWFSKDGKHETVMFVEATENSELKYKVQAAAKRNKIKVKVLEKSGISMKSILQKSDPFDKIDCQRRECVMCNSTDVITEVDCRSRGCVYEMVCSLCKDKLKNEKYRGQTGRSMYERMKGHFQDWNGKDDTSALLKHANDNHNGSDFPIEIDVVARCFGKPTCRLITESVLIDDMDPAESMNRKEEWGYVKLPGVNVH